jgi:hypothetical protein
MSKINEIIDGLIFIKDGTKVMSERETINKACDILAKVERGELVEVVRCKDCFYRASKKYEYDYCEPGETYCNVNDRDVLLNFYCGYGKNKLSCTDDERSGEK